jgi:hypothetical protein
LDAGGFVDADIAVSGGKIIALGKPPVLPETAAQVIDAKGKKIILDSLIRIRITATRALLIRKISLLRRWQLQQAVYFIDRMPNVNPPTTTVERYRRADRASSQKRDSRFQSQSFRYRSGGSSSPRERGPARLQNFYGERYGRDYPHMPGIGLNNNGELFKCFETRRPNRIAVNGSSSRSRSDG